MPPPGHFVAVLQSLRCNSRRNQSPFFTHSCVLQEGKIELLVSGQDGSIVRFRMQTDTPLRKCMLAYAKGRSMPADELVFMHDGMRVSSNQSCQDLDIQTGDSLQAWPVQVGD